MQAVTVERLDHLGIVAGVCREIGLAAYLDELAGPSQQQVSVGVATVAMILNGLASAVVSAPSKDRVGTHPCQRGERHAWMACQLALDDVESDRIASVCRELVGAASKHDGVLLALVE